MTSAYVCETSSILIILVVIGIIGTLAVLGWFGYRLFTTGFSAKAEPHALGSVTGAARFVIWRSRSSTAISRIPCRSSRTCCRRVWRTSPITARPATRTTAAAKRPSARMSIRRRRTSRASRHQIDVRRRTLLGDSQRHSFYRHAGLGRGRSGAGYWTAGSWSISFAICPS